MKTTGWKVTTFAAAIAVASLVGNTAPAQAAGATSPTFAGYGGDKPVPTKVQATWIVPQITCDSAAAKANAFLRAGIEVKVGEVGYAAFSSSACIPPNAGPQVDQSVVVFGGNSKVLGTTKPGDRLTGTVQKVNGKWQVSIKNNTRGWNDGKVAPAGMIIPTPVYKVGVFGSVSKPLPKFATPIQFSAPTVNGAVLGTTSPTEFRMVKDGKLRATPSATSRTGFIVTWKGK